MASRPIIRFTGYQVCQTPLESWNLKFSQRRSWRLLITGPHPRGSENVRGLLSRYSDSLRAGRSGVSEIFLHFSRSALYKRYRVCPGGERGLKQAGRGVDHLPPRSAEFKERVELYIQSPSGPSWPVLGWTLLKNVTRLKSVRQSHVSWCTWFTCPHRQCPPAGPQPTLPCHSVLGNFLFCHVPWRSKDIGNHFTFLSERKGQN